MLYIPSTPATAEPPSPQSMLDHLAGLFSEAADTLDSRDEPARPSTSSSMAGVMTPMSSMTFSSDFPAPTTNGSPTPMPKLENLPRPDQLFSQSKIHIISMRMQRDTGKAGNRKVELILQSTHEQSLKLIHDYFTRWTRTDMQTRDKLSLVRHTLCPSTVGQLSHDTLVVEPSNYTWAVARNTEGTVPNPVHYQCFIENVLGYEVVHRDTLPLCNGSIWEFRRTVPFA